MKLNLGCGRLHLPGYTNVDVRPPADLLVDLDRPPWPFDDSSVETVTSTHCLEHVREPRQAMKELHRILVPGGRADVIVPYYRNEAAHSLGHRSYWSLKSMDPLLAGGQDSSESEHLFDSISIHLHYIPIERPLTDLYYFLRDHLPAGPCGNPTRDRLWSRLPYRTGYEVHYALEAVKPTRPGDRR